MNLDELKKTWQDYDQQLAASRVINEKLIKSMMKERSNSTLAKIRRESMLTMVLMTGVAGFCGLAITSNAFDYQYPLQYIPLAFTALASLLLALLLVEEYSLARTDLNRDNLADSLKKVLLRHERFTASSRKLVGLLMIAGLLWPVSHLPRMLETKGLFVALGGILLTLAIQVGLLLLAKKLGAFEDRHGKQLRAHLQELEELEA